MPTAEARVRTDRATRYLTQLCKHTARISVLAPGHRHDHRDGHDEAQATAMPRHAEYADTEGRIAFDQGRCTLRATSEELILRVEADDQRQLRLIQEALGARLQRIGNRDQLTLTWQPLVNGPGSAEPHRTGDNPAAILESLMTPDGRADPFPLYATAHELGPVLAITDGLFLACGYAAVNQVLREPRFGPPGPVPREPGNDALRSMSRSILRASPPEHTRMRSVISKAFTPRRIAALQPAIETVVAGLLDQLAELGADGQPVDFMDNFAFSLPVTVICELLGVPPAERPRFRPMAADLTEALELSADSSGRAGAAARELAGYFTELIGERRAAPGDDLVTALITARDGDDGVLSDEELLANLILLLVAGFETTTSLLGNGLAILLDLPDLAPRLRAGRIPITGFIDEVLRYDSPVQMVTREARTAGLEVDGIPIPEGGNLILLIGAANRDPARYPDPGCFDPARTDIRPLSFGAGPHICIGNSLARLEASAAFSRLLGRFPNLSAVPGSPPTRRDRLVLRGYHTLPVQMAAKAVR